MKRFIPADFLFFTGLKSGYDFETISRAGRPPK
jgi:hypothetical protein